MNPEVHRGYEAKPENDRRREVIEMHLFDDGAAEENALCEAGTSADDRRGMSGYLRDRFYGVWVGTVCEACKALAVPLAANLA